MKGKIYKSLSIRQKLIFIITLTSAVALLLAFSAFSINNIAVFNEKQKNKLQILVEVIADNSEAAVSFYDQATAKELLSSLRAEPHLSAAVIYTKDGKIFAHYGDPNIPSVSPVNGERIQYFKNKFMHTYSPIILDQEKIGTIYLKSGTGELRALIKRYLLFGFFIIFVCIAAASVLATALQKTISEPISDLTQLAEAVSRDKNYSLRAIKKQDDELGTLVERFNEMLSEIQKREEALIRSNEALTRSNHDLEQFAYVASHDLQEPLRMVLNYAGLLKSEIGSQLNEETQKFLEFLTEGASRSQQLISDLLQYSRVRLEGKFNEVDTEEVLNKALANLKLSIQESGAVVTHDKLPKISADPLKLWQVFQNLIGNAIKFHGGENPKIHVGVKRDDDKWIFSISDNGIGIDSKYLEKIFVIFKRLHTREKYSGTGIGLAIVKKIVEQHGGTIWVESTPGKGSTFFFTIPI